jgi:glycine betaine catabolism B
MPKTITAKKYKVKIKEIVDETHDVKSFKFDYPKHFDYVAGQFIMISLNIITDRVQKTIKRAYSLSSSPSQQDYIETIVKLMGSGSTRLFNHNVADELEITGPYGMFKFEEDHSNIIHGKKLNHIVLIAAGSGITAPMSIARYILDSELDLNVTFIFSNKTSKDIIVRDELEQLSKENKNFNLHLTTTQPDKSWSGHDGRIDENIIKKLIPQIDDALFYLCGPVEFCNSLAQTISTLGADKQQIKMEKYD